MGSPRALRSQFHEFARRKGLIDDRDKIVAAVSGGVDSMVLLDLLAREQDMLGLTIIVAHFNFMLRGEESRDDEEFVIQRTRHYGFESYVERADTVEYAKSHKLGVQEAARNLRYEFFDKLLLSSGFDKIATAHNADDNAETMLLNLFRGAGVAGLAGIPVYREDRRIIRPLLFAERKDIETYAREEKLPFREDSSNSADYYSRNFVRHHVLPRIRDNINPDVVATVSRSSELFRELDSYLQSIAIQNYESVVVADSNHELQLAVSRVKGYPKLVQQLLVIRAADQFAKCRLDFEQVQKILDLTEGLTGSWVPIHKGYVVFRDRDHLVFRQSEEAQDFRFAVLPNHQYAFERFSFSSELVAADGISPAGNGTEYVDADALGQPELILRSWNAGDAFIPLGMKSAKKISDFFVDAKVPIYAKRWVPILTTKSGDIVWVCGHRIDDRFKLTEKSKRALRLRYSPQQKNDAAH